MRSAMQLWLCVAAVCLACSVSSVAGGSAASAAVQLGPGVHLGQSSLAPLQLEPSSSDLCPVIQYAVSVEPIPQTELEEMKAATGAPGKYASDAEGSAAAGAKPYRITLTPLRYANNASVPSVDWVDVHFRTSGSPVQQSVQTKISTASSHSHESSQSDSHKGASYSFGPIFLAQADTLSFGHTICASMIDCNTEIHSFQPAARDLQLQQAQVPVSLGVGATHPAQPSVRPETDPKQSPPADAEQQQPAHPAHAEHPTSPAHPPSAPPAASGCPAVAYTHKMDCGASACKISFVSLTPGRPLDWVDAHIARADAQQLGVVLAQGSAHTQQMGLLADPSQPQLNLQMALGAGVQPLMMASSGGAAPKPEHTRDVSHAELNSDAHKMKFGWQSAPHVVLEQSGGTQVWQIEVPMSFHDSDLIAVSFTYSLSGIDCDTELSFYKIEEIEEEDVSHLGPAESFHMQPQPEQQGQRQFADVQQQRQQLQHQLQVPVRGSQQQMHMAGNVNVQQMLSQQRIMHMHQQREL